MTYIGIIYKDNRKRPVHLKHINYFFPNNWNWSLSELTVNLMVVEKITVDANNQTERLFNTK